MALAVVAAASQKSEAQPVAEETLVLHAPEKFPDIHFEKDRPRRRNRPSPPNPFKVFDRKGLSAHRAKLAARPDKDARIAAADAKRARKKARNRGAA